MAQKKIWAAVMCVAVCFLSVFWSGFSASAEVEMCSVTVEIFGNGSVSDGSASATSVFMAQYPVGQTVTLTATPGTDKETLYWVNGETDRVLSFTDTYSFTAGSDWYMYVVFEDTQSVAMQKGEHKIVYLTEGDNILHSETVPVGSTAYYDTYIASITLYVNGKTWTGWDKTPAQVAADTGRVFVRPTYSNAESYTVTVIIGDTVTEQQGLFERTITVSAPATLDGEPFSYWIVPRDPDVPGSRDAIASYKREYSFSLVMPTVLQAVYGEEVTGDGVVTRVVGETHDFTNTSITFHTEWNVTSAYTVSEAGLLFTRNPAIGNFEDELVLNTGNNEIKQGKSKYTTPEGSYSITVPSWVAVKDGTTDEYYYPLLYMRSYLKVTDSQGNSITYYSPIFCADYVNEAFVGQIIDNPNPDPFG